MTVSISIGTPYSGPSSSFLTGNHHYVRPFTDFRTTENVKPKKCPDVRIAIIGPTGTGKSSFISLLTGNKSIQIGRGLESKTGDVKVAHYNEPDGRRVTFLDIPSFDDSREGVTDAVILRKIAAFLDAEFKVGRKLNGLIYLQRITDNMLGGISVRNLRMFKKLCGSRAFGNVAIVSTCWDELNKDQESMGVECERELMTNRNFFQPLVAAGALLLRHNNTRESAGQIVLRLLGNNPIVLRIQKELERGKSLQETTAGVELNKHLDKLAQRHKEELERVRGEMQEAFEEKNKALEEELERRMDQLNRELKKWEAEKNILHGNSDTLKAEVSQQGHILDQLEKQKELRKRDEKEIPKYGGLPVWAGPKYGGGEKVETDVHFQKMYHGNEAKADTMGQQQAHDKNLEQVTSVALEQTDLWWMHSLGKDSVRYSTHLPIQTKNSSVLGATSRDKTSFFSRVKSVFKRKSHM